MNNSEPMFYTYLLRHKSSGRLYYGSSYGRESHPSKLWDTYFSSSKIVKAIITNEGKDSFEYQVRRQFDSAGKCRQWEAKFLDRVNAARSELWLNRVNGTSGFYNLGNSPETVKKILMSRKGYRHSNETKAKMRKPKPSGFGERISKIHRGVPKSDIQKQRLRDAANKRWSDPDERHKQSQRLKGKEPWNKGISQSGR